jgi:uncharacterized protein (DUF302 family)
MNVKRLGNSDPHITPVGFGAWAVGGSGYEWRWGAQDDAEAVRAKIEAVAGPSGFMLFGTAEHGAPLRLAGQKRKAIQYVLGNPLVALQMTRHDIRAGLYAPPRVLLYENEAGEACLEYDRPSSLFGQFRDDRIAPTAALLDGKPEALAGAAMG